MRLALSQNSETFVHAARLYDADLSLLFSNAMLHSTHCLPFFLNGASNLKMADEEAQYCTLLYLPHIEVRRMRFKTAAGLAELRRWLWISAE